MHEAVPWFRPENKPLLSDDAKDDQKFRVFKEATGRTFPSGKFNTQIDAENYARTVNAKRQAERDAAIAKF